MKRTVSFALALLCVLPLFACGGGTTENTQNSAETAVTNAVTEAQTTAEYTDPKQDFKGASFCFLDYDTEDYYWKVATYSDINAPDLTGDAVNDAQYERNSRVMDLLNFKLTTHPVGGASRNKNHTELTSLILAQDSSVDAAFIFGSYGGTLITGAGYLLDMRSIDNLDLSASWWDQNVLKDLTFYNSTKLVTGDISFYAQFAPSVLYFNKELAEDNKIPDMYDSVRDGTWTFDKMISYMKLVSADLNGDGVMDKNDRLGYGGQRAQISEWIFSGGVDYTQPTKDGGVELCCNTQRTIDIIEKYVPVFNDKSLTVMTNDYSGQYGNAFREMLIPMLAEGRLLFNYNQLSNMFDLREMEADFGILPLPKYDEDQKEYRTLVDNSWITMLCVPVTCTQTDKAGYIFDALGYYSQQMVTPTIIDVAVTNRTLRDEDSAEMLRLVLDTKCVSILHIFDWGGAKKMIHSLSTGNNTNFASGWAGIESAALSALATTLEEFKK